MSVGELPEKSPALLGTREQLDIERHADGALVASVIVQAGGHDVGDPSGMLERLRQLQAHVVENALLYIRRGDRNRRHADRWGSNDERISHVRLLEVISADRRECQA
jgi:hypothetical protein